MSGLNDDGAGVSSSAGSAAGGAGASGDAVGVGGGDAATASGDAAGTTVASSGPTSAELAAAEKSKRVMRLRLVAVGSALVGMVLGAVVEMFVQGAMESTGWFGPTMDTLIADQKSNFEDLRSKLEALKSSDDPAERARLERELETLIIAQEKLASRTHLEIRDYQQELEALKKQVLAAGGGVGGADFWVAEGESVSVGERSNVIGVTRVSANVNYIYVNYEGKRHTLNPGDAIAVPVSGGTGKVIFKQVKDGRAGFDFVGPGA